ncbi:MAG: hypothetical protein C0622_09640 [Desulfuromonas sp.]|nr:MAG: hypothetical protein C0622_09640 [Desulfuromonas sp.]
MQNRYPSDEEKYRLIAEKTSDVIWLADLDGRALFVSPSIERLTGFTPEEHVSMSFDDRFTPESAKNAYQFLRDYRARLLSSPEDCCSSDLKVELEYRCKDGSSKWGEVRTTPYCDDKGNLVGFHGVTRDITERRQAEEALQASEEKYRLLSKNAMDVIWRLDLATERFRSSNCRATRPKRLWPCPWARPCPRTPTNEPGSISRMVSVQSTAAVPTN